ncbi:nitrous oxide reductase accessory protein NosL [Candidatus Magnetominusculus dajiuhuensis]|uniref:nitrous oxide reductase accessory protein NosL n=1 Tax=Candidatus Magnetominusculus dajiuhuensis TaxID=3137712 RepID=UPI003B438A7A
MSKKSLIIGLLLLTISVTAYAAEPHKASKSDKCAVCGMLVGPHSKWLAQIIFKDGTSAFFDGPKDMFKFYFDIPKYNTDKTQADIEDIYVTEYYTAKPVKAQTALYVVGSNVMGPMGKEFVPVTPDKANNFMVDHKGQKSLKFDEIKAADLQSGDTGMSHSAHKH